MSSAASHEIDSLGSLEERIHQAIQLVSRLRAEKQAAEEQAAKATEEAARLSDEVQALQTERKEVRQRIERLLGQIDQLSA
jgi:predicted  nucleic acid-binding Zn-ribbon protein